MSELLRYKQLLEWMQAHGVAECECKKLVRAGLLGGRPLRTGGRKYYALSKAQALLQTIHENQTA